MQENGILNKKLKFVILSNRHCYFKMNDICVDFARHFYIMKAKAAVEKSKTSRPI